MVEHRYSRNDTYYIDLFFYALGAGALLGWAMRNRKYPQRSSQYDIHLDANFVANAAFGDDKEELSEQNIHEISLIAENAFGNDKERELVLLYQHQQYISRTGDISHLPAYYTMIDKFEHEFGQNRTEEDIE